MSNYYLYRDILSGAWQIDAGTFITYYPLALNAISGKLPFDKGEEEQSSKPFTISLASGNASSPPGSSEKYIKVIPVRGVMLRDDAECGPVGMRTIGSRLLNDDKNPNVIGCILLFDSGGGQASAVPELTDAIQACQKPVIAFVDGMACSAAMYSAAYCKEIIASRETDHVGCIGTMISMSAPKIGATDSDGNTYVRIYADGSEEKNEEFEQAIEGNYKLIKERVLNPNNEKFKADIRRLRPNVSEAHLKGRTYEAKDVMGILLDSIGDINHAVNRIVALSESDEYKQNTNQNNFLNMNEYPTLLAALGISELAVMDGSSSLNEEQLAAIESALSKPTTDNAALEAANTTIAEREQTILQLNAKLAELEKKPGADSAAAIMETDKGDGKNNADETFFGRYHRLTEENKL